MGRIEVSSFYTTPQDIACGRVLPRTLSRVWIRAGWTGAVPPPRPTENPSRDHRAGGNATGTGDDEQPTRRQQLQQRPARGVGDRRCQAHPAVQVGKGPTPRASWDTALHQRGGANVHQAEPASPDDLHHEGRCEGSVASGQHAAC